MVREVSQLMLVHYLFPTPSWGQRNQDFECNCGDLEEAWPGGTGCCQMADCCDVSHHQNLVTEPQSIQSSEQSHLMATKLNFFFFCEHVKQ